MVTAMSNRMERWRPQPRRRLLVAVAVAGWVVYVVGQVVDTPLRSVAWPLTSLVGLLLMLGAWGLLRAAIRSMADLPDERLDERQVQVRDRSYLHAYRIVGGLGATLGLATIGMDALDVRTIPTDWLQTTAFGLMFLMMVLPSCVVGWQEAET
ncbi:MAG: hypothetical protein ACFCVC_10990 [Acidimicrobiia bacterium]